MGVRKLNAETDLTAEHLQMKDQIVAEMQRPEDAPASTNGPVVLMEEGRYAKTKHYYVVWDQFADLDQETRGSIVFQAVKEFDADEAMGTTIAMGFTRSEAEALELTYENV